MESIRIVQVCKEIECLNTPEMGVEVGNQTHNFCCIKGLEKALNDFSEHLKSGKTNQNN